MATNYRNLVFTNHAAQRLDLRRLTTSQIWDVITNPDKTQPNDPQDDQVFKFTKTINDRQIQVVAKHLIQEIKQGREWLIISVWVRGEEDPVPWIWKLLILPFQILWWAVKMVFKQLTKK